METKSIRKSIRSVVAQYKLSMFGRRSCVDVGCKHWSLEYGVLFWREASKNWGEPDWDEYASSSTEKDMFRDLKEASENYPKVAVAVRLICEHKTNTEQKFDLEGKAI